MSLWRSAHSSRPPTKEEQMTSHKHVLRGLIVPVAAALAIAGCGSSGNSSPSATTGGGAGSSGSEIVIGSVGSYTGAQASSQAGVPMVLKAWPSWSNAHGGVRGHPGQLIINDVGSNAASGLADVNELVQPDP